MVKYTPILPCLAPSISVLPRIGMSQEPMAPWWVWIDDEGCCGSAGFCCRLWLTLSFSIHRFIIVRVKLCPNRAADYSTLASGSYIFAAS